MSDRIESLIGRMSWEQKLLQLQIVWRKNPAEQHELARRGIGAQFWPPSAAATNELQRVAIEESALGIPMLIALDVVHGQFTIFPTPLAEAASFDPDVAYTDARFSATEARKNGVNWVFSPMIDVTRDARWGRVVEGFGEDVYLGSRFAEAKVRGYQTSDLRGDAAVAACLKHFVGYGAAEGGRDYNTTDMSERRLRDIYLETFRTGVAAGAASVMASFNALNGTPMHANRRLLTEILKDEWGFDGVVVGDAEGVAQLETHGIVMDEPSAIRAALLAGVDVVMGGTLLVNEAGVSLLQRDEELEIRVDDAVRRVLRLKERLGLFDAPYVAEETAPSGPTIETLTATRETAQRCVTLLRNANGTLPLREESRVLLAGPYARSSDHLGAWVQHFGAPVRESLADSLQRHLPDAGLEVFQGCGFFDAAGHDLEAFRSGAESADVIVLAVGEPSTLSGEASSRSDIRLPDAQHALIRAAAATKRPVVVVLVTGRPLVVSEWVDEVESVLVAWHLGSEAPAAIAAALTGGADAAGRLPMTFPRSVGQLPYSYDQENTGRPAATGGAILTNADAEFAGPNNTDDYFTSKYIDLDLGPQFAFGHGGSYTSFELTNFTVRAHAGEGSIGDFECSVEVRNTGERRGDDVVMLFIRDEVASLTQPVARLRGFHRRTLEPGASETITFFLPREALGFWTNEQQFVIEPGEFAVWVDDGSTRCDSVLRLEGVRG